VLKVVKACKYAGASLSNDSKLGSGV